MKHVHSCICLFSAFCSFCLFFLTSIVVETCAEPIFRMKPIFLLLLFIIGQMSMKLSIFLVSINVSYRKMKTQHKLCTIFGFSLQQCCFEFFFVCANNFVLKTLRLCAETRKWSNLLAKGSSASIEYRTVRQSNKLTEKKNRQIIKKMLSWALYILHMVDLSLDLSEYAVRHEKTAKMHIIEEKKRTHTYFFSLLFMKQSTKWVLTLSD